MTKSNRDISIHFHLNAFSEDQKKKLYRIEKLLHEMGITFDTGTFLGTSHTQRDWEFDKSLKGPVSVTVK